jgi:hypothetical protein
MERRPALIVSTAAAVAFATAGFGYAATNLLTQPANDQVGRLTAAQAPDPAPRQVQYIYDEVPVEVPDASTPPASAQFADDANEPSTPSPTIASTTTTTATPPSDAFVENEHDSHPEDTQHAADDEHANEPDSDD